MGRYQITAKRDSRDMCAVNDPLGQTHSRVSSDHYSQLKVVLFCEILKSRDGGTDVQTTLAKIVITTGRECGSPSWIKRPHEKKKAAILFGNLLRSYCFPVHLATRQPKYLQGDT